MTGFLDQYRGTGPLRDLTVLDFSQMMLGPLATQLLGDLGALVIKVERPVVGEWERSYLPRGRRLHGESPYFLAMNRNKLSFTADLKSAEDLQHIYQLVGRSDALVHNYRPGVMERLALGYEELRTRNPRLIYASGSGYGVQGPMVGHPGQDLLLQAFSGLAANSGSAETPPTPLATPVVDASTGFLLAFAVVSAVLEARASGQGRQVNASLLGSALLMQCQEALAAMNTDLEWERSQSGLAAPWADPPYGIYRTRDSWIAVAMAPQERVIEVFNLPAQFRGIDADEFYRAREEINAVIQQRLRERDTDTLVEQLTAEGLWVSPVLDLSDTLEHPQVEANRYVEPMEIAPGETVRVVGLPIGVSGIDRACRLRPPGVGEHNEVITSALNGKTP